MNEALKQYWIQYYVFNKIIPSTDPSRQSKKRSRKDLDIDPNWGDSGRSGVLRAPVEHVILAIQLEGLELSCKAVHAMILFKLFLQGSSKWIIQ